MIDQELLKACILHPWSVVPRMMLIDSMIENGWEEFKSMEAFEPPTVSNHLPLIYYYLNGFGGGIGIGIGSGSGNINGSGRGRGNGIGSGYGNCYGRGNGIMDNSNNNVRGCRIILEQQ